MKIRLTAFAACTFCLAPALALAQPAPASADVSLINWHVTPRLSVSGGVGYLSGTAKEFVYDPSSGSKLSELDWQLNNAAIVKGAADLALTDWFSLSLSGWTAIGSDSVLDDYDWLVPSTTQWSDHSHHSDTRLRSATQTTLGVALRLYHAHDVSLSAVAGYQWTQFKWRAYGGSYVYTTTTFRDTIGSFTPGQLVGAYSQHYQTPFLGIAGTYDLNSDWQLSAALKGSPWGVSGSDLDNHALRSTIFTESTSKSQFFSMSIGAAYAFNARTQLAGTIDYQSYSQGKASSSALDQTTGTTSYTPGNAAGLGNDALTAGISLRYSFGP